MMTRIRDLDFNALLVRVVSEVDRAKRRGPDPLLNTEIKNEMRTPADVARTLRNHILIAACLRRAPLPEGI